MEERKVIILAGAGQIGSRHLQGLMKMKTDARIIVFEPDSSARDVALVRALEAGDERARTIEFVESARATGLDHAHLAIIATGAAVRPTVVSEILQSTGVDMMILEKIAYQSSAIFKEQMDLLAKSGVRTWVNCPRRLYPFYSQLKKEIAGPLTIRVSGSGWGLGCNSVHYIDLFSFLSGSVDMEVSCILLDSMVHDSKRKGFSEFNGMVEFRGRNGSLRLESLADWNAPLLIDIIEPTRRILISETGGMVTAFRSGEGKPETTSVSFPYQSGLTGIMADELLATGNCDLPDLEESYRQHTLILPLFTEHYNKITGAALDYCPIT